jgi:hypothetical protein
MPRKFDSLSEQCVRESGFDPPTSRLDSFSKMCT